MAWGKVPWKEFGPAPGASNVVIFWFCARSGTAIASAATSVCAANRIKVLDLMLFSPFGFRCNGQRAATDESPTEIRPQLGGTEIHSNERQLIAGNRLPRSGDG